MYVGTPEALLHPTACSGSCPMPPPSLLFARGAVTAAAQRIVLAQASAPRRRQPLQDTRGAQSRGACVALCSRTYRCVNVRCCAVASALPSSPGGPRSGSWCGGGDGASLAASVHHTAVVRPSGGCARRWWRAAGASSSSAGARHRYPQDEDPIRPPGAFASGKRETLPPLHVSPFWQPFACARARSNSVLIIDCCCGIFVTATRHPATPPSFR